MGSTHRTLDHAARVVKVWREHALPAPVQVAFVALDVDVEVLVALGDLGAWARALEVDEVVETRGELGGGTMRSEFMVDETDEASSRFRRDGWRLRVVAFSRLESRSTTVPVPA